MFQGAFKVLAQQVVKRMRWTVPNQDLPRPIVEHHLHALDLSPRVEETVPGTVSCYYRWLRKLESEMKDDNADFVKRNHTPHD